MKRYRKKAKLAITAALAISSLSSGMNYVFAEQENKVQENANNTEESSIEKEEVVEEKTETVEEEKEELQNQEKATGDVELNVDNFPDDLFRKYASDNFDKNGDGILSSDELNAVTRISLGGSDITSVIGIEYFPNLENLQIDDIQVTSIDVSKNLALETIWLNKISNLTNLNLQGADALRSLTIYDTPLTNIDVSNNLALKHFYIYNTQITSIDFSKNLELVTVVINSNKNFEGVDITNNSKLSTADFQNPSLAWINLGDQESSFIIAYTPNTRINLGVLHDDIFNIQERFPGIDPNRIMSMEGAEIDKTTGIVSNYEAGKFINYTYDCGSVGGEKKILNVTLDFKIASTISINDNLDKEYDGQQVSEPSTTTTGSSGAITFEWFKKSEDGQWVSLEEAPTNAGNYGVKAYLAEDEYYAAADSGDPTPFTISKAQNQWITELSIQGWVYGTTPSTPQAEAQVGDVTFTYASSEDGLYTEEVPSDAGTYWVKASVEALDNYERLEAKVSFMIEKAKSSITIHDDLSKAYDGEPVSEPTNVEPKGSGGDLSFEWYTADGTKLAEAPANVGNYKVKAILAEDSNYYGVEVEKDFTISQAKNEWITELSIENWGYGTTANAPQAEAQFGTVSYTYSTSEDGTYTEEIPSDVGTYWVKAVVEGTDNYGGLEAKVSFQITKADSSIIIQDDLSKTYDGNPVTDPTNVETTGSTGAVSFEWYTADGTKLQEAPVEVGSYKVKAILAGDDNYAGAEVEKAFTISQTAADQITVEITNDITRAYVEGQVIENPEVRVTLNGSEFTDGTITFEWYKQGETTPLASAPMNAGSYEVIAKLEGTTNYASAQSAKKAFTIRKAESTLEISYAQNSFIYGNEVPNPTVKTNRNEAEVTFRWYRAEAPDTALAEKPSEVGDYLVEAYVEENENYLAQTTDPIAFAITKKHSTIAIHDDLNKAYDGQPVVEPTNVETTGSTGAVSFEWYAEDGTKLAEAPVNAGNYKVKAILAGDANYEGVEVEKDFTISQAKNEWITELSIENWVYGTTANAPQAEAQFGTVSYTYSTSEDGVYTEEVPSDAGTYWVKAVVEGTDNYEGLEAKVTFQITQATSSITIHDDLSKAYDGTPVSEPANVETTGSQSKLVYEWYTEVGTKLAEAPMNVGNYKVKAILAGDENYEGAETEVEFSISKASNAWATELSMQGWVYGEEANTPQAEVQFGNITYTYSISEDGVYTEEVPSDAGTYWVKASVEGTDNYEGLEAKVSFTIEKANSSITIDTDLNKVYDGQPVSEPSITQTGSQNTPVYEWYVKDEGNARTDTWTKLAEAPVEVGSYKLVVSVAEDKNYHGATAEVEFSIKVETVVVPTPPNGGTITNPDGEEIVVKPGDNIESNGPVVENPDGSITFPEGGTVTKPDGSVEVIQPGGVLNPNNPSDEGIETPGETIDGVQTGDTTQTSVWAMLVGLSMSMMCFFRRKKNRS